MRAIRSVGYRILYVVMTMVELVITFSTLLGLWGSWLIHSLLCGGYGGISYYILHVVRATGAVGHYIFYVVKAVGVVDCYVFNVVGAIGAVGCYILRVVRAMWQSLHC